MKEVNQLKALLLIGALTCIFSTQSIAGLITNGGFESGFIGWTRADKIGEGTFIVQTGLLSPINSFSVPTSPEGSNVAMTDSEGPGSHALYQDFLVPTSVSSGSIGFSLFLNNQAQDFFNPGHLDFSTIDLNQQARVDILSTSADPFAVNVLKNLFQTTSGDPLVSGYNPFLFDVTGFLQDHQGETLRLRFSETDNVNYFNFGVDNVSLSTQVPEPSSLLLVALYGFSGLTAWGYRRRAD